MHFGGISTEEDGMTMISLMTRVIIIKIIYIHMHIHSMHNPEVTFDKKQINSSSSCNVSYIQMASSFLNISLTD